MRRRSLPGVYATSMLMQNFILTPELKPKRSLLLMLVMLPVYELRCHSCHHQMSRGASGYITRLAQGTFKAQSLLTWLP